MSCCSAALRDGSLPRVPVRNACSVRRRQEPRPQRPWPAATWHGQRVSVGCDGHAQTPGTGPGDGNAPWEPHGAPSSSRTPWRVGGLSAWWDMVGHGGAWVGCPLPSLGACPRPAPWSLSPARPHGAARQQCPAFGHRHREVFGVSWRKEPGVGPARHGCAATSWRSTEPAGSVLPTPSRE